MGRLRAQAAYPPCTVRITQFFAIRVTGGDPILVSGVAIARVEGLCLYYGCPIDGHRVSVPSARRFGAAEIVSGEG